jgi:glutamate 5-kinase
MYNGAEKRMGKGRFCREFAVKTNKIMDLNTVKTVVVKIGTSTLTYENGKMNLRRIDKLCRTLCDLQNGGRRIVLVTSGAIGVGMGKLGLPERPDDTAKKQALAAIGQCELMFAYDKFFGEYHQNVAQVLLTADVTSQPISRRNVENTFRELLDMNVIPIVNENDTVAVDELEGRNFGDNDTLSAIVAGIINADVLMILTDIDGVYDSDPRVNPEAKLLRDITYQEVQERDLKVMDASAITICRENKVPCIRVFGLDDPQNILRVIEGDMMGTVVHP